MVEFGLKLQDNRVEEWSDKYIDYEKLKRLIQNVKKAHMQSRNTERRNEFIVGDVRLEYETNDTMVDAGGGLRVGGGGGGLDEFLTSSRHSELSALTNKSEDNYGAVTPVTNGGSSMKRSGSNGSLGTSSVNSIGSGFRLLAKMSQASGQFHRHRQGNRLKEAWKLEEKRHNEFSRLLLQEVSFVSSFSVVQSQRGSFVILTPTV